MRDGGRFGEAQAQFQAAAAADPKHVEVRRPTYLPTHSFHYYNLA
jgi:hypothetical protein